MNELNLPEKFRELIITLRGFKGVGDIHIDPNFLFNILFAFSEARDELHKKDCIIGDLLGENKRLRKENEICTCKKIKWNPK